jgi:hypothetical protein
MRLSSFSRAGLAAVLVAVLAACSSSGTSSGGSIVGREQRHDQDRHRPAAERRRRIDRHSDRERRAAWRSSKPTRTALRAARSSSSRPCSTTRCKASTIRRRRAKRADVHRRPGGARDGRAVQFERRQSEIPLTNDAGLAQISPSNTNDGLTIGDAAKKLRTAHPDVNTYFRVCTRDSKQGPRWRKSRISGWASRRSSSSTTTRRTARALADVFDASFRQLGGTVLGHEHITSNQSISSVADEDQGAQPRRGVFRRQHVDRRRPDPAPDGGRRDGQDADAGRRRDLG